MQKIALVFDVDETITKEDTIFAFFDKFGMRKRAVGIYEWSKSAPENIRREYGVQIGKIYPSIDVELILKEILSKEKRIPIADFEDIAAKAKLAKGAEDFFRYFSENKRFEVFFITSQYRPIAEKIAKRLGISRRNIYCTELTVKGKQVIAFQGPVMESERKLDALKMISKKGFPYFQIFTFGDSASDRNFIGMAIRKGGVGVAVRPNSRLISYAKPQYIQQEPDFQELKKIVLTEAKKRWKR